MTEAAKDPNAQYEPKPYPMMVYRDRSDYRTVNNEDEYDEARADGYVPFSDLPETPADDLDKMNHGELTDKLIGILRQIATTRSRQELIELIRVQEVIARHNGDEAVAAQAHQDAALEAAKADLRAADGDDSDDDMDILYGSSILPAEVGVGGKYVQLGAVVHASFVESELSIAEWNDLATVTREDRLQATIDRLSDDPMAFLVEIPQEAVVEAPTLDLDRRKEPGEDTTQHHSTAEELQTDAETVSDIRDVQADQPEAQAAARGDDIPAETAEDEEDLSDGEGEPDPFDHDGDGKPGGSLPEAENEERDRLRADLDELGIPYHHKAGVPKLRKLLDDATAPKG